MSSFTYKIIKANWGINISIVIDWLKLSEHKGISTKVSEKLFFAIESNHITKEQSYFLQLGLDNIALELDALFKDKEPVVVVVKDVLYNPCDYQDEGLACAIIGWISKEFGITSSVVNVTFNKSDNRYDFQFPKNDCFTIGKLHSVINDPL